MTRVKEVRRRIIVFVFGACLKPVRENILSSVHKNKNGSIWNLNCFLFVRTNERFIVTLHM